MPEAHPGATLILRTQVRVPILMPDYKVVKPGVGADGKISRVAMIVALVNSGVPLDSIAIAKDLTEEEREQIEREVIV